MIAQIPLLPLPSQTLQIALNGQQCTISVYARNYVDLHNAYGEQPILVNNNGVNQIIFTEADGSEYLIANSSGTLSGIYYRTYMDLWVSGAIVFTGFPIVYGSKINQYFNPKFNGFLFINTEDKRDPIYTNFGTTTTLNYTDDGIV